VIVGDVHSDIYHRRGTRNNRRRGADWRRYYDPCTRPRRRWNEDTGRPHGARPRNYSDSRNRHGNVDSHRRRHETYPRFSPEAIHKNDITIAMFIIRLYPRIARMRRCNPVTVGPHPISVPHPIAPNPYSIFKWRRWRRFHQQRRRCPGHGYRLRLMHWGIDIDTNHRMRRGRWRRAHIHHTWRWRFHHTTGQGKRRQQYCRTYERQFPHFYPRPEIYWKTRPCIARYFQAPQIRLKCQHNSTDSAFHSFTQLTQS
jgi:hypothetical protein